MAMVVVQGAVEVAVILAVVVAGEVDISSIRAEGVGVTTRAALWKTRGLRWSLQASASHPSYRAPCSML